jgi:hypothetical protein
MLSVLKIFMAFFVILDFSIFMGAYFIPDLFAKMLPQYTSTDDRYSRLIGTIFLMFGIARLHGILNIHEKGAYRVCLWSWILEFGLHAYEIYKGELSLKDGGPILLITGMFTVYLTSQYKHYLYSLETKKR